MASTSLTYTIRLATYEPDEPAAAPPPPSVAAEEATEHVHPLLLHFHRVLHARETHGRVPSHDHVHLVDRSEQNRCHRYAPNLDCDPCCSSVGCDLLSHTYGMSAPWPTAFFLGAPLNALHLHRSLHDTPCPPGFKVSRRDSCLGFLARPPASQSVLHCCTLQLFSLRAAA